MQPLTPRQKAIYDFIVDFRHNHGCSPSIPELQRAFFIRSPNGVVGHLLALEAKGFIRRSKRGSRQIDVVAENADTAGRSTLYSLPVLRRPLGDGVAPRAAGRMTLDATALGFEPGPGSFVTLVRGCAMASAGILPGDLAVIEPNQRPMDGDTVVAVLEGEYELRRLLHSRNKWYLRAEPPRRAKRQPRADIELAGVVRTVIRRFHWVLAR